MTSGNLTQLSNTRPQTEAIQNPKSPTRIKIQNLLLALLIAGVAMVLFTLTRFGQFQNEDFTLMGQLATDKNSLVATLPYFTSNWGLDGNFYAPLPRLFFLVEYRLFQAQATGWHVISALLHAGCAVLVWLLALKVIGRPGLALCAGLFFAVQPVHVPIVAQVTSQAELLAAFFCLASAVCFITARRSQPSVLSRQPSALPYWLSAAFYGLALLCKQEAIALPLALLAYDFVTDGLDRVLHHDNEGETGETERGEGLLGYYLPFLALLALYLIINYAFLGGLRAYAPLPNQPIDFGEFLRGNLRSLADPFGLGGTDGLILLTALAAFLALTGVQEWEAWQINHPAEAKLAAVRANQPLPTSSHPAEDDDELDDPNQVLLDKPLPPPEVAPIRLIEPEAAPKTDLLASYEPDDELDTPQSATAESVVATPATSPDTQTNAEPVGDKSQPVRLRPAYWTLRTAAYGFMWTVVFLLPFVLQAPAARTLYLPSAGFALFLAAILTPFTTKIIHNPDERLRARTLFGRFELSFWLKMGAILALLAIYFAMSVTRIDEWNKMSKAFAAILGFRL